MIDPIMLCNKHLLGEHVELHMFVGTINKGKKLDGYKKNGLVEVHNIRSRHKELVGENSPNAMDSARITGDVQYESSQVFTLVPAVKDSIFRDAPPAATLLKVSEMNILTVGVITLPFLYEGPSRMRKAQQGLEELRKHVDTIIVIPNQNLFKIANEQTTFEDSFNLSNNVLMHGVQSITDLMVRPGLINLDFADVETVMASMGKAMMGLSLIHI